MHTSHAEITLSIKPKARLDVIDVRQRVSEQVGDFFSQYRRALYYSYHTTAGFIEQSLCERFRNSPEAVRGYVESYQRLFPPRADYHHDQLHRRHELSEEQRQAEPLNGDSHLTFIGSGLANCVTYENRSDCPVYLIDLDGIYREVTRQRRTTIVGFDRESLAAQVQLKVPVSNHPIDSINLKDERLGLFDQLQELIDYFGVVRGRVDIMLAPSEEHAGVTVNEYETLLMKHDLVEVLRYPFSFMAEKGRHMLRDPRAIPGKAINYAKYDLVRFVNESLDKFRLSGSVIERLIDKFLAVPAERFLRMKRQVSLPVSNPDGDGSGSIVEGLYQSPILVQWRRASGQARRLDVRLVRFE